MAANWISSGASDPQLSSTYANIMTSIRERDEEVAKQFNNPSGNAVLGINHVAGTIRFDGSKWLKSDGAGNWAALVAEYDIDVTTVKTYEPGNASGKLAINNGTMNTNLIAEKLGTSGGTAAFYQNANNLNAGKVPVARLEALSVTGLNTTGNAATVTVSDNATTATYYPLFATGATGSQGANSDADKLTYNPGTGAVSATTFIGSGTSLTGISATVQTEIDTKAELAGAAGQIFSAITAAANTNTTQVATTAFVFAEAATKAELAGSASQIFSATTAAANTNTTQVATTAFVYAEAATKQDTLTNIADAATANGFGTRHISTSAPSGGSNGDVWYKV
jgi:hypothetical protein